MERKRSGMDLDLNGFIHEVTVRTPWPWPRTTSQHWEKSCANLKPQKMTHGRTSDKKFSTPSRATASLQLFFRRNQFAKAFRSSRTGQINLLQKPRERPVRGYRSPENKACGYYSGVFKGAMRHYSSIEQEATAMVQALESFSQSFTYPPPPTPWRVSPSLQFFHTSCFKTMKPKLLLPI